jgi:hypothetical protein
MDIGDFVRARLDEDEQTALAGGDSGCAPLSSARLLRQVSALLTVLNDHADDEGYCARCSDGEASVPGYHSMWPCPTLVALAGIWSDHPDYPAATNRGPHYLGPRG